MKVLFIARHFTYFRNFDSVLVELARRGYRVHVAADREEAQGGRELVERLAAQYPDCITVGFTPILEWGRYRRLAGALRLGLDYLRYTDPRYEATPRIRERAYERTPLFVLWLARLRWRQAVTWLLEHIEAAVPRQAGVDDYIREHDPDLLLITPLIELGSPQLDYVRAARRLGVRSALCVWSWDHLSSKALIRVVPDAIIVWNETQRDEAARFHGIPADKVIVTGAQCFDRWFDRRPARDREAFCAALGLPPERPFLLYVCSALFKGSPSESAFVSRWIGAVRASSHPALREIGLLVRPHPQRLDEWRDWTMPPDAGPTVVWGSNPVDEGGRSDYFDSMYHSAAVVGLNTSALVEAAVVGRPVYTLLLPEFEENQEGTFHFHHLLRVGGGCLDAARGLDEHVAALERLVTAGPSRSNRAFVEEFVRPHGADRPATPAFVEALERMTAGAPPRPRPAPAWTLALRPLIWALVLAGRLPVLERIYWNPVKREKWAANVRAMRGKDEQRRMKRLDKAVRLAHKVREQAVVRTKTALKQALNAAGLAKHS